MQTSSSSSRPSRRGNRMHLLQLAETMAKQLRHRQRQDVFSKWKLFVVMKAVGILVQSAAFLSPAQLLSTSTNGGGPLPLTLLIKAGKRATIKKRVVSTTRIFRSSISEVGGTTSTSSAALGQLAHQTLQFNGASPTTSTAVVKPLPLISSTAAVSTFVDALLVPSCMKPNGNGPTTSSSPAQPPSTPPMATSPRGSRTSPTLELTSTPTTSANAGDGLADFLNGIGACGAINSPVSASDMSLASLVKEVQLLRATVEAQKRTIDMRDRYINELVRRQDTDLSLRDIERDHVLQQAVSKLESSRLTQQQRSRAGSRVLVGAASPLSSVPPAVATSPSSAPLSPPFPQPPAATTAAPPPPPPPSSSGGAFHHQTLSQATQTLQQIDGSISSSFDGKTVIPMPPVSPVDSNAAGSGIATTTTGAASSMRLPARSNVTSGGPSQNRSSSNINNNKKRNSVDNAMLLQHQQQQQSSSTSSTPRGAGEQTVDETPTTMSVSNVVAGMSHNATGRTLHQKSSLTSSHPASSMSSSSAASQQQSHSATQKKGDHNPSASPMVVFAAQPQMVSLSISSMLRPAVAHPQQPHHHVNPPPDHQPATDFVLLSARGVINNANHSGGGGGGSTSQPTSSRKVHALRGTSLLPILSQQQQQQALLQGSSVVGNSSSTTTTTAGAAVKGSSSSQPSVAAQQGK